jgi:segregation and condensation protein A
MVHRRPVMTLDEALTRLERMLGLEVQWTRIEAFLPETQDSEFRKSALASSFVAALELAKQGRLELDQHAAFGPLFVRAA